MFCFPHSASTFMKQLDQLYEAQNMDDVGGELMPTSDPTADLDLLRLRAIVDNVVEHLPPLLELGAAPETLYALTERGGLLDFPYHRPSVLSLLTAESTQMPESLGFVLLQVRLRGEEREERRGGEAIEVCHRGVGIEVCQTVLL